MEKGQDFAGNLKQKVDDITDFCKDTVYFYVFPHNFFNCLMLSITMVWSFTDYYVQSELSETLIGCFFMYFGLTKVKSCLKDRRFIGGTSIALRENVPQFLIQFYELFSNRNTITWIQVGFPLLTLTFIYQFLIPIYARLFYNHNRWDGMPSKKDRHGKIVERT